MANFFSRVHDTVARAPHLLSTIVRQFSGRSTTSRAARRINRSLAHRRRSAGRGPSSRAFIEKAYWIVGTFCFYWIAIALNCVLQFRPVTLPIFGESFPPEAMIFTLSFLWLPLLGLHLLVFVHQRYAGKGFSRLPGMLTGDLAVPAALSWLRIVIFLALVVGPTIGYIALTKRTFDNMTIVWKPDVETNPTTASTSPNAKSGLALLTRWSSPPNGDRWIFNQGWRWKDQYVYAHKRIYYKLPKQKGEAITTEERFEEVLLSAIPGLQPTLFLVAAGGFAFSLLRMLWFCARHS